MDTLGASSTDILGLSVSVQAVAIAITISEEIINKRRLVTPTFYRLTRGGSIGEIIHRTWNGQPPDRVFIQPYWVNIGSTTRKAAAFLQGLLQFGGSLERERSIELPTLCLGILIIGFFIL